MIARFSHSTLPKNCIGTSLRKLGCNEGRNERKQGVDSIQERRRHVRIPRRTCVRCGVRNCSTRYWISHPSWPSTTCLPNWIYKRQFGQSKPRPLRSVRVAQRVGESGAFRGKSDHRIGYKKIPGQSIWLEQRLCTHLCEGHYHIHFCRVRSGRISRPRGEPLQVGWPMGRKSSLLGTRTTSSENSRVCNWWRKDNPWWRYRWHNVHYCIQYGTILQCQEQVGR